MVMVKLSGGDVSIDGFLKQKLDNVKKIIKKNFDCVILIDGKERIGKSTLGLTIGSYLDPSFSIENVSADSEECVDKIEKLPDKSILLIDEGSLVLSSKDAMKKEQRKLIKILNVVGQKNMIFIVVLPSFFELNKYIATDRARFLLHCYSDPKLNRGRFAYFGQKKLKKLYEYGKKNYGSYKYPKAGFIGRFFDYKPEWYEKYLETKKKSLISALREKDKPKIVEEDVVKKYVAIFRKEVPEVTVKQIATGFGRSEMTIYRYLKAMGGSNTNKERNL